MDATQTALTVREFLEQNNEAHDHGPPYIDLVCFGGEDGNWLRLMLQNDGRIDLVDRNCSDTGSNISDEPATSLVEQARDWIECVYPKSDRDFEREETGDVGDVSWHEIVNDAIPADLLDSQ